MAQKWLLGALAGTLLALPAVSRAEEQPAPHAAEPPANQAQPVQMAQAPSRPQSDTNTQSTNQAPKGADAPAPLPPLPGDLSPEVRAYLEALQRQVQDLQSKLNQGQKQQPVTPTGAIPAVGAPPVTSPVPSARTLTGPLASRLQIGGYAELRITNLGTATGDRTGPHDVLDFQVARFRPRLTYFMDPHWEADLQINASTRSAASASFTARDAYVEYHNGLNNQYALRLGQQKVPFGYETFVEGDEPRPALERARYHEVLVPDQRDIGVAAIFNPRKLPLTQAYYRGPLIGVGVYNGNSINKQDNDLNKNVIAEVRLPLGGHNTIGLSGLSGTFSPAVGKTFAKQAGNFDWEGYYGRFRTQFELMAGRHLGHDINGGFGQLEYVSGAPGSFFVRYDRYDPDVDAKKNVFDRLGFGWYKDFTKNVRITAEYDFVTNHVTQTRHPNTFGIELQTNW